MSINLTDWTDHVVKHEDRSSSGCGGLSSSRTLRCWNQGRIPIWWQNLFLGSDSEWNQQILDRNVRRDSRCKCCAKVTPPQTSNLTLSRVSVPFRERKWIDIEPGKFDKGCLESKLMIRLLRRDYSMCREANGAVRFEGLASIFRSRNESTSHWPIRTWISFVQRGGGPKKRFQYCLNLNSPDHFLYLRAIQGHSGGALVDPTLQDNVLLPDDFLEHICHVGHTHDYVPSSSLGWFWVVKVSREIDMRCSSQPSTRCASTSTKKSSTTWKSPGLQCECNLKVVQ